MRFQPRVPARRRLLVSIIGAAAVVLCTVLVTAHATGVRGGDAAAGRVPDGPEAATGLPSGAGPGSAPDVPRTDTPDAGNGDENSAGPGTAPVPAAFSAHGPAELEAGPTGSGGGARPADAVTAASVHGNGEGAAAVPPMQGPGFADGPVFDGTAPGTPGSVTATALGETSVRLTWQASSDDAGPVSYAVSRGGSAVGTTSALAFVDGGLSPGTTYTYTVVAVDGSGNVSAPGAVSVATPQSAGGGAPIPMAVPYVRMWTEVNNPSDARAVNELAAQTLAGRLDALTSWYVHFHSEASNQFPLGDMAKGSSATTLAEKLSAKGAMVSAYRNGSYVTQSNAGQLNFGEAGLLESTAPLAIGTWWPGHKSSSSGSAGATAARLVSPVTATQPSVTLSSAAPYRASGAPETWPYIPSRGSGAVAGNVTSQNSHDFVSWVRIDDEIMRVRAVSGGAGTVTLTVDRGYFGTSAAAHGSGTRVMSPVYIGSSSATQFDTGYAGSPNVDRTDKALRYGIKIWQGAAYGARKDGIGWIAGRIATTFGAGRAAPYLQGYDTVWLDVSSCATYNNADSSGQPVTPWSEPHDTIVDATKWKQHQLTKLAGLRAVLGPARGYRPGIRFTANNLASQGSGTTQCRNDEMAAGGFDGGVLEHWLQNPALWSAQVEQSFQIQSQNLPGIYWLKTSELSGGFSVAQYKRFAYGSFLLTKRDGATRYQFGGMNHGLAEPDELFRWDLGAALDSPARIADLAISSCSAGAVPVAVYRRDFTKGYVLVNTSDSAVNCPLATPAYDVLSEDGAGQPQLRSVVTVGPRDAAFLVRP